MSEKNVTTIQATLESLLVKLSNDAPHLKKDRRALAILWKGAAGEFISRYTRPHKIVNSVLHVGTPSEAIRDELLQVEEDLVKRLRATSSLEVKGLKILLLPKRSLRAPGPTGKTKHTLAITSEDPNDAESPPYLKEVRQELRPIVQRLLRKHSERQRKNSQEHSGKVGPGT